LKAGNSHTPIYSQENNPERLLSAAYYRSLELALKYNGHTIAFPAISCGAYGYPAQEAENIAINTCRHNKFKEIHVFFYWSGSTLHDIWKSTLRTANKE